MIKVFLVEDESIVREGLRDNMPWQQQGYQFVGEASDGEMALPMIRKLKPDVLFTDIKMPFMDGLALSRIVSQEFPDMKIIILSGYDDFEYARSAIRVGVEQYLLKPITKSTMTKVLSELRVKIEAQRQQSSYQDQYQDEMREYEKYSRRIFFEKLFEGHMSVQEIYDGRNPVNLPESRMSFYGFCCVTLSTRYFGGISVPMVSFYRVRRRRWRKSRRAVWKISNESAKPRRWNLTGTWLRVRR